MSIMHYLIVGLGNPGKEYAMNRHNVGFIAIDYIAAVYNCTNDWSKKYDAYITTFSINEEDKVTLVKPLSYMNLSGISVQKISSFFKIQPKDVWVIHDDIDLSLCKIKLKKGGGHGGHNGLKSIDSHITPNYHRLRIGIGRPEFGEISNFVLSNFTTEEFKQISHLLDNISKNTSLLLQNNNEKFLLALHLPTKTKG